ncbi:MAG: DUF1127 domain-containing protein [Pseudomonadota bacterium]
MAYNDTHHASAGDVIKSAFAAIERFFAGIGNTMISVAEGNRRIHMVARLQEKSDAELQDLGLRREDIVRHVFRDVFFT